ncbi:hypothetical protein SV7mr_29680 [Stieleria bergensis]|uniref:Uncharacterized protein n=1 Tax=Stieleria bergensis TaxID=2528025 RepID=A0A517SWD5_9BACT|nr:hypothetical protein SV7mr_29680 [Planctomycetes bacterium SV_7m_r]
MSVRNLARGAIGGLFEKTRKCTPIPNDSGSILIHYWADSGRMEAAIAASFLIQPKVVLRFTLGTQNDHEHLAGQSLDVGVTEQAVPR